ncbi:MAG TPA: metalloregulator ArsR/SmtB family transcription factor [Arthrobacter sp.]|nr:metalloregulator ArsR/SmtB family transcription factor [Arthrobacter sp.]
MTTLPVLQPATTDACCAPAAENVLGEEAAKQKAVVFKALADPNRLRLLSMIKNSSAGETCVCDLIEPLDLGQPTVSHHLKILVDAGLLHREKRGTWAYFSVVPGALDNVTGILAGL